MTPYSLLIFLHVLGAVGMFTAWGIEGVALALLARAATSMDVRSAIGLRRRIVPAAMAAMLTAIITGVWMMILTGVWMMILRWGRQPWEAGAGSAVVARDPRGRYDRVRGVRRRRGEGCHKSPRSRVMIPAPHGYTS